MKIMSDRGCGRQASTDRISEADETLKGYLLPYKFKKSKQIYERKVLIDEKTLFKTTVAKESKWPANIVTRICYRGFICV